MSKISFLVLCFVAVSLSSIHAISEEEIAAFRTHIMPFIEECSKEYGLTLDDLIAAKKSGNVDAIDPCFMECMFKKANVFNSEGKFDLENGLERLKMFVKNEDDYNNLANIGKECASVNEKTVNDAGCERAKLLAACFAEHKSKIVI